MQGAEPPNVHPVLRMQDHRRDHPSLQSSWQSTQRRVVHFTGPAGTYHQNPGTRSLSEEPARPAPQATSRAQHDRTSRTRCAPRPSRPSHQVVRHPTAQVVRGHQAAAMLAADPGYAAVRELDGIGPVLAAVICAEIGDVTRFRKPGQLCSWAGLTPRHYESDTKVIRGHVSKQGSKMLRWALTEAIQHQPAGTRPREAKEAIIARRGEQARNIAKTAAARVLLTQVFYALRDGHARSAGHPPAA